MSRFSRSWATKSFFVLLVATLTVYILRGLAILTMLPGSVIWVLLLLTILTGVLGALETLR
jgi:hypothetical protein